MTTLYVDNIAPNLQSRVSVPGHVIQVVQAVKDNRATTQSTSFTSLGLSASITPSSESSKVLIIVQTVVSIIGQYNRAHLKIAGTTSKSTGDATGVSGSETTTTVCSRSADSGWMQIPAVISFLDSPASTSQQTYTLEGKVNSGSHTLAINSSANTPDANVGNSISTITLMEIAG